MKLKTTKMDVWAGAIEDRPGGLGRVLRVLGEHGINLDCVLARREGVKTGNGVMFVSPALDTVPMDRIEETGLHRANHLTTLKIEGDDRPGLGADLATAIAEAGVNLHGLTAVVSGPRFVCYASFDSQADLETAAHAIQHVDTTRFPRLRKVIHRMVERTPAAT